MMENAVEFLKENGVDEKNIELLERVAKVLGMDLLPVANLTFMETIEKLVEVLENDDSK